MAGNNITQSWSLAFRVKGIGGATGSVAKLAKLLGAAALSASNGAAQVNGAVASIANVAKVTAKKVKKPLAQAGQFIGDAVKDPMLSITKGTKLITEAVSNGIDRNNTVIKKYKDGIVDTISTATKVTIKGNQRMLDTITKTTRKFKDGSTKVFVDTKRNVEKIQPNKNFIQKWLAFSQSLKVFVRQVNLAFYPFKIVGKLVGKQLSIVGKILNFTLIKPLKMVGGLAKMIGKGFMGLGSLLSSAFTVGLGPIGLILKLLSPLLSIVVDSLSPAFETFSAAIEVALGPLSFVLEALAQQLAPLIVKTLQPFVGIMVQMVGDLAPKLVSWLSKAAVEAAPLAMQLADKLVPAFQNMLEAMEDLAKTYGPAVLDVAGQVFDFFLHFQKYMGDFYLLFIQPIVDGVKGIWATVQPYVQPIFDAMDKLVSGLEIVKKAKEFFGGAPVISQTNASASEISSAQSKAKVTDRARQLNQQGMSPKDAQAQAEKEAASAKPMAAGGITTKPLLVGEAGPEAIMPLRPDAFADVLGPLLTPGFEAVVDAVQDVGRALRGTITVTGKDVGGGGGSAPQAPTGGSRSQGDADLAVSFGMVPRW